MLSFYPICRNLAREIDSPGCDAYMRQFIKSLLFQIMAYRLYSVKPIFNTLRPRQDGRNFSDDIFKCIFLNENTSISIDISLKFVPRGRINNIPALVQIMAWRRSGDKPLSEPMMASLLTHICVARPQWVNLMLTHCPLERKERTSGKLNPNTTIFIQRKFLIIVSKMETILSHLQCHNLSH